MIKLGTSNQGNSIPPGAIAITTTSQSLRNMSVPIPITGIGIIQYELKVHDITRAALRALVIAGTLLPDVTYHVTDPQAPLDHMFCRALRATELDATMSGLIGGEYVRVGWSPGPDRITEIYCPRTNNRTARSAVGARDCIEMFDTVNGNFRNCVIVNSDFLNAASSAILDGLIVDEDSTIILLGAVVNIDGVRCGAGTLLTVENSNIFVWNLGARADVVVTSAGGIWGHINVLSNETLTFSVPQTNKTYHPTFNEIQFDTPADGGFYTFANSQATNVYLHLTPAATIPTYTLELPFNPLDGQIFHFASTEQITGLILTAPGGHTISGTINTVLIFQSFGYYFDRATNTFYLVQGAG